MTFYAVSGVPDVRVDGKYAVIGAGSCNGAYTAYRTKYVQRMTETANTSPVAINGSYSVAGGMLTVNATYALIDPVAQTGVQATFFISEDDVYYSPTVSFDGLTRKIYNQPVTLTNVGDQVAVSNAFTVSAAWNLDKIHVICILQKTSGTKEVIQAAELGLLMDFVVTVPYRVTSVPDGSADATFPATITNTSAVTDVMTLSLDGGFGWPAGYQVAGDPNWYSGSHPITLAPGGSANVTIKVTTDDVKRIGNDVFKCQSGTTGRLEPIALRVFNKSKSVLFIDDDGTQTYEVPFNTALTELGYLYEEWDVTNDHGGNSPTLIGILGFDAVVWQTGRQYAGQLLNVDDQNVLKTYLDGGGKLFLDSPAFLNNVVPPNVFVVNYLGVASRSIGAIANVATGVAGDPITSGMSIPLTFAPGENQTTVVNPTATASAIFFSQLNEPIALRNALTGNGKVVFSTILQDAMPQGGAAPNNSKTFIERTLNFLLGVQVDPASVPDGPSALNRLSIQPNPVSRDANVQFRLSSGAAAGTVQLVVVDVTGRAVRTLVQGRMEEGIHSVKWNGSDDSGRMLPSGVYFAKLQTADGDNTQKLLLTR